MLKVLESLCQKGAVRQLDYQFALFIASQEENHSDAIGFLAGILSAELSKGHICIEPESFDYVNALGLYGESALALSELLEPLNWAELLKGSDTVGEEGDAKPLIFDGKRLYLQRYWLYEQSLAQKLLALSEPVELSSEDIVNLGEILDRLFARQYRYLFSALKGKTTTQTERQQLVCDHLDIVQPQSVDWTSVDNLLTESQQISQFNELDKLIPLSLCINWQKVAAAIALTRRFSVISGGPGTGKTTTVAKLLVAVAEQEWHKKNPVTIKLVAPTGKAAARLTESLGNALRELDVPEEIKSLIPTEAGTVHRLLGAIPNRAEFRHHADNLLHLDVLVIDEASMVDLSMMHKLMQALPPHARLILLGDKDQLSSVEAGAVLGEICSMNSFGYSKAQSKLVSQLTQFSGFKESVRSKPVADCLCLLQKSYRFDARSGIGQLAKMVNAGATSGLDKLWQTFDDIHYYPLDDTAYKAMLSSAVESYTAYLKCVHDTEKADEEVKTTLVREALKSFSRFRLLCAVREGDFGVTGLNQRVEKALAAKHLITPGEEIWYPGRPVMITQNDYALGLFNGDIGICMFSRDKGELKLKVYFELPDGDIKAILPSRIPEHETAYAMTIHKSQGSEFDNPVMILPPKYSPVLTRELIYTGITRAKKQLTLYAETSVLIKGIKCRTERQSGLLERISI